MIAARRVSSDSTEGNVTHRAEYEIPESIPFDRDGRILGVDQVVTEGPMSAYFRTGDTPDRRGSREVEEGGRGLSADERRSQHNRERLIDGDRSVYVPGYTGKDLSGGHQPANVVVDEADFQCAANEARVIPSKGRGNGGVDSRIVVRDGHLVIEGAGHRKRRCDSGNNQ